MKIKSLVPWYGSKRTLAPRIIQQFGPHATYVEPFAGSLAVLLAKPPARHEVVSDLHEDLINLLRVLCDRESAERLHGFLSLVPYCETLYLEACERLRLSIDDPILRARDYMLASWQGRNGLAGTTQTASFSRRMNANGSSGPCRWRSVINSVPPWHERLRNVEFHQRDALESIGLVRDQPETVLYLDPPYVFDSRSSDTRYLHEMKDGGHQELASSIRRFKETRVVVSYYRSETTDALYEGWNRLDLAMRKDVSQPASEGNQAQECVYVNGPIFPEA